MKYQILENICQKVSSNIKQSDLVNNNGDYPIYGASGFIKNVDFYMQDKPYIGIVKDGAGVGRVTKLPAFSSVIGTMQYIIPNDDIDVSYLAYAMEHMNLSKYYMGAAIPHIYFKDYKNEKLPNHTKDEQAQIVHKLDLICDLITKRNNQLSKLDELIKSRFVEMFGDIYSNTHKFPVESLSDSILFLTSGSRGWAKYCVDSGKEWFITIKNVKDCRISTDDIQAINAPKNAEANRTRVNEGDLLISITADLGRTGVITKEIANHGAYINQHLTCIRLDRNKLNPLFVAYFMESESGKPQFEAKNQNGVKAGLNFDSIKSLKVLIPPIELQNQFADFVTQVEKQKTTVQQSIDKLETLKNSLMQEYFN